LNWNNPIDCPLVGIDTPRAAYKAWLARAALEQQKLDAILKALKDCHDRLELLTDSGRGKMLDAIAEGNAAKILAKYKI
jgi:hypothetical protein